jgi:hypothetical protein
MLAAPKVWAARRSAMKRRADTEQMSVGAGQSLPCWARVVYYRYKRGVGPAGNWHSGGFEFSHTTGFFSEPCAPMGRYSYRFYERADERVDIELIRPLPLKMNELREIDLFPEFKNLQR